MTDANHWRLVGPAHKQRFLEYDGPDTDNCGDGVVASAMSTSTTEDRDFGSTGVTTGGGLRHLRYALLQSAAFGRWLGYVTCLGAPRGVRGRIRRFRPGLDYTVAHYGVLTTHPVLDATLCFCAGDGAQCAYDEETNDLLGRGRDRQARWCEGQQEEVFLLLGVTVRPVDHSPQIHDKRDGSGVRFIELILN
jgi:hypothetical protein